jgi:hypothetical protein
MILDYEHSPNAKPVNARQIIHDGGGANHNEPNTAPPTELGLQATRV